MLYRFLHLLQARPGQAGRHFQSPKVHLCGRVSRAAESGCRPLLSLIAAAPTPNGRHATHVIGRDWRHTHGTPWRELDTPTVLDLFRMWNKQPNLVVYCAFHLTYVSIQANSNSATNFPNMLAKSGLIIYRTSKSLLGNFKKKYIYIYGLNPQWRGGFGPNPLFMYFFLLLM